MNPPRLTITASPNLKPETKAAITRLAKLAVAQFQAGKKKGKPS